VGLDVEMAQQLASDLGVGIQFVRFDQVELPVQVRRRTVDIVMTGARLTPERSAEFVTSEPYLDETLAIVAPDHTRQQFRSWEAIRSLGPVRLGVQNLPYYIGAVRSLMPDADLTVIAETTELIQPESGLAAYVLPAERGSVLTMLNPQFTVVVPEGARVLMPLAYPIAGHDPAWVRYVDTWIQLKRKDGFVDALYEQWILGHAAASRRPRWSIIRDVLGWID
jgi:ABC-type amino acid transport substrate-binding protein